MGSYISKNGLGLFFNTTGIIFLILGVIIFIFFLSIDPGYGWTRNIDLTKNYIMIFTSLAVSIVGIVFIVTGQHINELHVQDQDKKSRCKELIAGNAENVMKKDWYSLRDRKEQGPLNVYLFQKKSNRNNYKIIATINEPNLPLVTGDLTISSELIPQPITIAGKDSVCTGIFEKDINIDFNRHQQLREQVKFDLTMTIFEDKITGTESNSKEKTLRFTLQSKAPESERGEEQNTQVGTQLNKSSLDPVTTALSLVQG